MITDGFPAEASDAMCLPEATQRELLRSVPYRRFAVFGDSLSAGTGDPAPGYRPLGWSDRVGGTLRDVHPDAAYRNLAVVGATTTVAVDSQLPDVLAFGPDLLHVPSGANDILGRQVDFEAVEHGLRAMYRRAAASGAQLMTFTFGRAFVVPRYADWTDRVMRINDLIRTLAAEHAAIVVDMWDHPVNDRLALVSADGIHFGGIGQAVMATEVVRALAAQSNG